MSGILIIHALLAAHDPLTDRVPAANIWDEEAPQDTALPAISLLTISGTDRRRVAKGSSRRVTERVQASLLTADAEDRLDIMPLIKAAGAEMVGTIAGFSGVSVQTDGRGPDFTAETGWRVGSQDFLVSFNETT